MARAPLSGDTRALAGRAVGVAARGAAVTVRCPQCSTRYRLPARSRLGRNPSYRCTRCRHVFAPDEEAEAPALEEDVDDFTMSDGDDDDDAPVFTIEQARPEPDEDDPMDEERAASAPRGAPLRPAERPPASPPGRRCWSRSATACRRSTSRPIRRARELFGQIPFIGDEMTEARLHPSNIQLADVRGEFKRVHGDRLVFVITGTAINNAPCRSRESRSRAAWSAPRSSGTSSTAAPRRRT